MTKICKMAIDESISPRMDLDKNPDAIESIMFSNEKKPSLDNRPAEMLMPKDEVPRVKDIAGKIRTAFDADGKPVSKMKRYNICDGLFEPIIDKFYEDPTLIVYGEDNHRRLRRRLCNVRRPRNRRADVCRLHRLRGR